MSQLVAEDVTVILHEPLLEEQVFSGARVKPDFALFKQQAAVIVANRMTQSA
jgi:UDPglucose 6-dehydrogenase